MVNWSLTLPLVQVALVPERGSLCLHNRAGRNCCELHAIRDPSNVPVSWWEYRLSAQQGFQRLPFVARFGQLPVWFRILGRSAHWYNGLGGGGFSNAHVCVGCKFDDKPFVGTPCLLITSNNTSLLR
jgi:hypothetical protein